MKKRPRSTPSIDSEEVFLQNAEKVVVKRLMKALEKKAHGGKLIIDFRPKKKLSKRAVVSFDPKKSAIVSGKESIQVPPYLNEYQLCVVMFEYQTGEAVDWSVADQQMTGNNETLPDRQRWRVVYDAVRAVNRRFRDEFDVDLFAWKEKTITRLR